jgi:hypothetical protein
MAFGIRPIDEPFGEDDIPFLEIAIISRMMREFFSNATILDFEFGWWGLAAIRLEYLRGHIGEKRFTYGIARPNSLFILSDFLKAAPFRAVFFVFSVHSRRYVQINQVHFIYCLLHRFIQGKIYDSRRFVIMDRVAQSSLVEEKLLIEGDI